MELILQTLLLVFLLGGMVFFPTVVAPAVFTSLEKIQAGLFLRKLFPNYYLFIIILSGFAGVLGAFKTPVSFICILILLSTLLVRQVLMPKINVWRDDALTGTLDADKKFKIAHRGTVTLNVIQMCALIYGTYFNIESF
jgi:hypothetical protein